MCPIFATSAPACAGHYLVKLYKDIYICMFSEPGVVWRSPWIFNLLRWVDQDAQAPADRRKTGPQCKPLGPGMKRRKMMRQQRKSPGRPGFGWLKDVWRRWIGDVIELGPLNIGCGSDLYSSINFRDRVPVSFPHLLTYQTRKVIAFGFPQISIQSSTGRLHFFRSL